MITLKSLQKLALTTAAVATLGTASTFAVIAYDQDVTPDVIFGSGNANGGFTTDRDNGVELGLRAKLRHNAAGNPENTFNSNGDGSYDFNAGVAPNQSYPTAEWSFEWSINSDYLDQTQKVLSDFTYNLLLDTDPTAAVAFLAIGDIINTGTWDHSLGYNSTTYQTDVVDDSANYTNNIDLFNVAQNSWKPHWFIPGFDPTVAGVYDIKLQAFDGSALISETQIKVNVNAVPDTGATAALLGAALLGLVGFRRFSKRS